VAWPFLMARIAYDVSGGQYPVRGGEATMEISWRRDVEAVLSEAQARGKHVLLDFSAAPA